MNEYNPDPTAKKVKYAASIIYLLVLAIIVGGSYINQQQATQAHFHAAAGVVWTATN